MCGQPPAPLHLVPAGGWITKPPPRLLGTTAGARLCLSGHAELSLGGGGGGGGTTGDPWHSTGSPGGGERKRQGCAAHVSVPQFHPEMLARRLRDGAAGRAGAGGGSRRDLGTQLPHPARSTCPPPRGCLGWGRGTSAPGDAWGGRAGQRSADGARRRAVLCGGDSPAVGARGWGPLCSWRGGHGGGEGAAAGAAIPAMPGISPARPHVPPPGCSAAGMRCRSPDMGAATPPPSHRDVSEAPGGSRSFLPSFLFLAPLLGPCLCPCHIFHAMMGEEEEALNGVG